MTLEYDITAEYEIPWCEIIFHSHYAPILKGGGLGPPPQQGLGEPRLDFIMDVRVGAAEAASTNIYS